MEILTQIFDITSKLRPYNVRDFDLYFELIMYKILSLIDILTKIRDILDKILELLTKIFEGLIKISDILTKIVKSCEKNVGLYYKMFDFNLCIDFERDF